MPVSLPFPFFAGSPSRTLQSHPQIPTRILPFARGPLPPLRTRLIPLVRQHLRPLHLPSLSLQMLSPMTPISSPVPRLIQTTSSCHLGPRQRASILHSSGHPTFPISPAPQCLPPSCRPLPRIRMPGRHTLTPSRTRSFGRYMTSSATANVPILTSSSAQPQCRFQCPTLLPPYT